MLERNKQGKANSESPTTAKICYCKGRQKFFLRKYYPQLNNALSTTSLKHTNNSAKGRAKVLHGPAIKSTTRFSPVYSGNEASVFHLDGKKNTQIIYL